MKSRFLATAFRALTLLLVCFVSMAGAGTKQILGYYESDNGTSSADLNALSGEFNQIASDTYLTTSRGVVTGTTFTKDLAFARSKGMQTFATISNFANNDFSSPIAHSLLHSSSSTQTFITGALKILAAGHYTGINIDFEAVLPTDRAAYTAFIGTVAQRMHASGYLVVISVPAELKDDPTDGWAGAFDFKALGGLIDILQLMTYDENGSWGDPGPVAGLDWVKSSVTYAVSVVPAAKVSLGIPAYGYDWDLKDSRQNQQITWIGIPPLLATTKVTPQWDATSSSPYFNYTVSGHKHVVWYENTKSIELKAKLVQTYHLAGVSVYALGMEDASFWQAIHSAGF